ncbi:hypothetical protein VZG47_03040 [Synechococcus elongatus IITB5]|uniref:hypothetical protein n=1 Tax=Synechococcus elongatus TaxID=32046 RepID=UPI0030D42DF0
MTAFAAELINRNGSKSKESGTVRFGICSLQFRSAPLRNDRVQSSQQFRSGILIPEIGTVWYSSNTVPFRNYEAKG